MIQGGIENSDFESKSPTTLEVCINWWKFCPLYTPELYGVNLFAIQGEKVNKKVGKQANKQGNKYATKQRMLFTPRSRCIQRNV